MLDFLNVLNNTNPATLTRIAKRNRVLPDHLPAAEVTKVDQAEVALALEDTEAGVLLLPVEGVKYSSPTFV